MIVSALLQSIKLFSKARLKAPSRVPLNSIWIELADIPLLLLEKLKAIAQGGWHGTVHITHL